MKDSYSVITDTFYWWMQGRQILQVGENFFYSRYNFRSLHFFINQIAKFVSKIWESRFRYAGALSAISGHVDKNSKISDLRVEIES